MEENGNRTGQGTGTTSSKTAEWAELAKEFDGLVRRTNALMTDVVGACRVQPEDLDELDDLIDKLGESCLGKRNTLAAVASLAVSAEALKLTVQLCMKKAASSETD